jgi:hypothetical protein
MAHVRFNFPTNNFPFKNIDPSTTCKLLNQLQYRTSFILFCFTGFSIRGKVSLGLYLFFAPWRGLHSSGWTGWSMILLTD